MANSDRQAGVKFCHIPKEELIAQGCMDVPSDKKPSVHIIYAHMEPFSFNFGVLEATLTTLGELGHTVTVSDLYEMKFNPIISRNDTIDTKVAKSTHVSYPAMMGQAVHARLQAEDIKEEQKKVADADIIIFQFPLQWFSMPAIMKGWMERVLLSNFAFSYLDKAVWSNGLLKSKKAILSFTTGSPQTAYPDINQYIFPITSSLRFCGLQLLSPHVCYAPAQCTPEERQAMLERWKKRLNTIFQEEPEKVDSK